MKTSKPSTTAKATSPAAAKSKASKKPAATPATPKLSEALTGKTAQIHDLCGIVILCLPQEMRQLLGEEIYQQRIKELAEFALLLILREESKVLYVTAPIRVAEQGETGLFSMAHLRNPDSASKAPKAKDRTAKPKTVKARGRKP